MTCYCTIVLKYISCTTTWRTSTACLHVRMNCIIILITRCWSRHGAMICTKPSTCTWCWTEGWYLLTRREIYCIICDRVGLRVNLWSRQTTCSNLRWQLCLDRSIFDCDTIGSWRWSNSVLSDKWALTDVLSGSFIFAVYYTR